MATPTAERRRAEAKVVHDAHLALCPTRQVLETVVPVRVDHALTDLARTLVPVLRALEDWSEGHIEQVLAAREAYDGSAAGTGANL